jgi:hypothetical protein
MRSIVVPENAGMFVKATDENMCGHGGFRFEFNKVFTHDSELNCGFAGFHCCDELNHIALVTPYVRDGHTRFFIVKAWGECDADEELIGTICAKKYAFEHMEFLCELKYMTTDEVAQSVASMQQLLCRDKRFVNLSQFFRLQSLYPSRLKQDLSETVTNDLLPVSGPNTAGPIVVFTMPEIRDRVYVDMSSHTRRPFNWVQDGNVNVSADVYDAQHEPRIGLCIAEARALCNQYLQEQSCRLACFIQG